MASEIITSIPQKYELALKSGDLLFFPSTVTKHTESDIDVRPKARA
jgi:ATP adenylyltransferase